MTPEAKVKQWLKKRMRENYPTCASYWPPGGAFGKAGMPDSIWCVKGIYVAIEVKSPVGKATKLQIKRLKEIKEAGGVAAVIHGCDEGKLQCIFYAIDKLSDTVKC